MLYEHPTVALTSGQAASAAIARSKSWDNAFGMSMGHSGAGAGASFIQVSFDYNPNLLEAAQSPTWLALKDAAGADLVFPTVNTARNFTIYAAAFRIKGGTSAAPANFSGNGVLSFTVYTLGLETTMGGDPGNYHRDVDEPLPDNYKCPNEDVVPPNDAAANSSVGKGDNMNIRDMKMTWPSRS